MPRPGTAARCARRRIDSRRERLEDRVEPRHRVGVAADHQAAPRSSAPTSPLVPTSSRCKPCVLAAHRPADVVDVVAQVPARPSAFVALQIQEPSQARTDPPRRRAPPPQGAWRLQLRDECIERIRSRRPIIDQRFHVGGVRVEDDARMTSADQPADHVGAHAARPIIPSCIWERSFSDVRKAIAGDSETGRSRVPIFNCSEPFSIAPRCYSGDCSHLSIVRTGDLPMLSRVVDGRSGWKRARILGRVGCALAFMLSICSPALAQLNTQHVKGSVGLKGGSQPPPGGYVVAPLLYFYNTDTVKNRDGEELPFHPSLNSDLFAAGFSYVTTKKVLGGYYGVQVLFPAGANNRIQGTENRSKPWCRPDRYGHRADPAWLALQTGGRYRRLLDFCPDGPLRKRRIEQHRLRHVGPGVVGWHYGLPEREKRKRVPRRHRAQLRLSIEEGRQ